MGRGIAKQQTCSQLNVLCVTSRRDGGEADYITANAAAQIYLIERKKKCSFAFSD